MSQRRTKELADQTARYLQKRMTRKMAYILVVLETEPTKEADAATCTRTNLESQSLLEALQLAAEQVRDALARRARSAREKGLVQ